jgi:SAM-dependent methyltransferase
MSENSVGTCAACGAPLGNATVNHLGFLLSTCRECGLWTYTDRTPADYEAVYATTEYEQAQIVPLKAAADAETFLYHPTYAPFFREVPCGPPASLLDVGCGVGRFLMAARSIGWTTRGIDVSATAVEIGRREAGLNLSQETLEDLCSSGARFDAVSAFEVLEHVPQPRELVASALAVLKDGGWFFCTVPNRESPTVLQTSRPDWLPPVHLQFFTKNALQSLLGRAGGEEIRTGLVMDEPIPRRLRGKVKRRIKRWLSRKPPDPLGIWGMARRKAK